MSKTNYLIYYIIFTLIISTIFTNISYARNIDLVDPISKESTDGDFDMEYEPDVNNNVNDKVWDPWEKMNRNIFKFNLFLITKIAKPTYDNVYVKITTPKIRASISNVVNNFRMPIIFANYVLQLDFDNSAKTLYTFGVNTVYGVFGIIDVASKTGVNVPSTNLGITLAKYYVPSGPFLMLPFFGPNDVTGTLTWGVELAVDPLNYNVLRIGGKKRLIEEEFIYARGGLYMLDSTTYAIDNFYDIMISSFDPYIVMRDAYGQSQNYKINKVRGKI